MPGVVVTMRHGCLPNPCEVCKDPIQMHSMYGLPRAMTVAAMEDVLIEKWVISRNQGPGLFMEPLLLSGCVPDVWLSPEVYHGHSAE